MGLEATIVCLDNSEWMRNGDFVPTRLQSQKDALQTISNAKMREHTESCVGVLTMGGQRTKMLINLTTEIGRIISAIHNIPFEGECDLLNAIQVAQLALKHRQNKQQAQRIICFVGSPLVHTDKEELIRLAKRLKKNNIAVDVINFGEQEANRDKLESFVKTVNNNDNSHIISVPAGPNIVLSEVIRSSPLIKGGDAGGAGGGAGFDVDPNMDPELLQALRISYEEDRARRAAAQKKDGETADASSSTTPSSSTTSPSSLLDTDMVDDPDIAAAIELSMRQAQESAASTPTPAPTTTAATTTTTTAATATTTTTTTTPAPTPTPAPAPAPAPATAPAPSTTTATTSAGEAMEEEEDEELRMAMELSLQAKKAAEKPAATPGASSTSASPSSDISQAINDPNFMQSLFASLPNVDPNDPNILNVLQSLRSDKKEEKPDDKKDKK
eukprot:TRINITY_DN1446_c0_g1_i4.p1 TRINITY_DN1446_c0_g1~~TRINITY_DN1446_c0_g1_i4.p1  ORF type:complete len:443 (-),score=190.39 TRINITY_DN1446_c0_g1_i4:209-1537(-)